MDDEDALMEWIEEARMVCAWRGVDPPPLAELLALAARLLWPDFALNRCADPATAYRSTCRRALNVSPADTAPRAHRPSA